MFNVLLLKFHFMIVSKVKYNPKQAKLEVQRRSVGTRTGSDYSLKPAEKPVLQHQQARSAKEWLQSNHYTNSGTANRKAPQSKTSSQPAAPEKIEET